MARYGRSTYRRKGRRGNRSLSTRRIFNNKGAKAQAKQIFALRKSINRVAKQCRPEYKLIRTDTENRGFGYDGTSSVVVYPNLLNALIAPIVRPAEGTSDSQRIGNKISITPLTFFMNVQYKHINEIVSNIYPYTQNPIASSGLVMRFVAVQAMSATDTMPGIGDIFAFDYTAPGTLPQDLMMMMTMPFKNGITARYKILKDKRYFINEDKPILAKRIKVKPVIKTLRWEDGYTYPRGMIFYILMTAGGDMLYTTEQTTGVNFFNYNMLDTTWRHEYAYTDA